MRRVLKLLSRQGKVIEIAPDHFFLRETAAEMAAIAADIAADAGDGQFNAAQFRDRLDNGRKVAIQILEFFDRHGVTLRRGDLRRVNPQRLDLFRRAADGGSTRPPQEENRPRWGVRTSNPGRTVSRSLVGSTPTLFRHDRGLDAPGPSQPRRMCLTMRVRQFAALRSNINGLRPLTLADRYGARRLRLPIMCH